MTQATADTGFRYEDLGRLIGLMTGAEKHGPAATSTLDVLWVLYDRVLRVTPRTAEDTGRDRFLLSKGHGPMAYYAVLAAKGFFPVEWLPGFGSYDSPSGTTRTAPSFPVWRSAAGPSGTDCRSPWAARSGCAPRDWTTRRCGC